MLQERTAYITEQIVLEGDQTLVRISYYNQMDLHGLTLVVWVKGLKRKSAISSCNSFCDQKEKQETETPMKNMPLNITSLNELQFLLLTTKHNMYIIEQLSYRLTRHVAR